METETATRRAPTIPMYAPVQGCTQPYTWGEVYSFIKSQKKAGMSLRQIANESYGGRVTFGAIQRVLEGHEPKEPKIREALGLPAYQSVVVITGGTIPAGAQVIEASQCACGNWFISNHPARKRCFICSPFRRANRKQPRIRPA